MEQNIKKIKRSINIYPIFSSFTGDLVFFIPIDTLFLTLAKGLNASQITAMTMVSLIVSILLKKVILSISKKIGNANSVKLGILLFLIATMLLAFAKSFILLLIYRIIYEIAFMFLNMSRVLLKNNLISINREEDYYKIRNKSKILYSIITMITALISGYLFNINNYLPIYISIIIYIIMFGISFVFHETKLNSNSEKQKSDNKKSQLTSAIFWVIISNALFFSIIKMGQNNSKLFMQFDFEKFISIQMVTIYISVIVFISRIVRLIGNVIFGKVYLKIKDKMSVILTILLSMAFLLLIIGHFINVPFIYKVITMSLGFFLILATRDSFQLYIEDTALDIVGENEKQKILIEIEVYRKIGALILSTLFTIILMKHELIVIEFILLALSVIEIFVNKKLCKELSKENK